jgi:hypothetical protein
VSYRSLALLAVVASSLAATSSAAAGPTSGGAVQIVKVFYDEVNAHQIDIAMRYVAPTAVFINPTGTYNGKAAIRRFLERGASEGTVYHHTNFRVHGGSVVYGFRITQYPYGIIATGNNGLTVVKAGKIVFDGTAATKP